MKRLLLMAAPLALITASPAAACSYTQAPEDVGDGSARFFARQMVAAATYVDLVLMEDDGTQPLDVPATGVLTLRSIAHLKGDGPDRFSLFGDGLTLSPHAERVFKAPLQHFTSEDGRVTPFPYNEERPGRLFPNLGGGTSGSNLDDKLQPERHRRAERTLLRGDARCRRTPAWQPSAQ